MRKHHECSSIELYDEDSDTQAYVSATGESEDGEIIDSTVMITILNQEDGFNPAWIKGRFWDQITTELIELGDSYTDDEVYNQ